MAKRLNEKPTGQHGAVDVGPEGIIEQARGEPSARVYVSRLDESGNRRSLGSDGVFSADAFDLATIADRFGGGEYYVQVVRSNSWATADQFSWSVDPTVKPKPRSSPTLAAPAHSAASVYSSPPWSAGGPGGEPPNLVQLMQVQTEALAKAIGAAVGNAQRPRTVGEMSDAELLALMGRAGAAAGGAGPDRSSAMMDRMMEFVFTTMAKVNTAPPGSFKEVLEGAMAIDRLKREAKGESEAPEPGVMQSLVELFKSDALIRKGVQVALDKLEKPQEPQPRKVSNESQPQRPPAVLVTESTEPALPAELVSKVPLIAKGILDELTKNPKLKAIDAAAELVETFGVETIKPLFADLQAGALSKAIAESQPALKSFGAWVFMFESSVATIVANATAADEEPETTAKDGAK